MVVLFLLAQLALVRSMVRTKGILFLRYSFQFIYAHMIIYGHMQHHRDAWRAVKQVSKIICYCTVQYVWPWERWTMCYALCTWTWDVFMTLCPWVRRHGYLLHGAHAECDLMGPSRTQDLMTPFNDVIKVVRPFHHCLTVSLKVDKQISIIRHCIFYTM